MPWLKKAPAGDSLAVSMSGVKLGDRVLILGCRDAMLIAALAVKAGLTGRACAVDADAARAAEAGRLAEREGALVESTAAPYWTLPFEAASFDLVVIRDVLPPMTAEDRVRTVQDARRVLRPGGRCVVIDTAARGGLGALLSRRSVDAHYLALGGAPRALEAEGFVAVRTLAERGGLTFVEGVKRNA